MDFLGLINLTILGRPWSSSSRRAATSSMSGSMPLDGDPTRRQDLRHARARGNDRHLPARVAGDAQYVVELKPNSVKDSRPWSRSTGRGRWRTSRASSAPSTAPSRSSTRTRSLEPILNETYGVIVYQDQVLQDRAGVRRIFARPGRHPARDGQKKIAEMEKQQANFLDGAQAKGVTKKIAERDLRPDRAVRWLRLQQGARGLLRDVAYQTAYLKANYPAEYLAALMGALHRQLGEGRPVPLRSAGAQRPGPAAGCQRVRRRLHGPRRDRPALYSGRGPLRPARRSRTSAGPRSTPSSRAREKDGRFTTLEDFCTRFSPKG